MVNTMQYVNPKTLINEIDEYFGIPFKELKDDIKSRKVEVEPQEIKKHLEEKMEEEKPGLRQRLESHHDIINLTPNESALAFLDYLEYERYKYVPYTLYYYKKYVNILKHKSLKIYEIIDSISKNLGKEIEDVLIDLDISLDDNGNILYSDVIRLKEAFIAITLGLIRKVDQANNLDTYLDNKISLDGIYRNGLSESEVYPSSELQAKNIYSEKYSYCIRLTEKQREQINSSLMTNFDDILDSLAMSLNDGFTSDGEELSKNNNMKRKLDL